jgi:hypothetical protein
MTHQLEMIELEQKLNKHEISRADVAQTLVQKLRR